MKTEESRTINNSCLARGTRDSHVKALSIVNYTARYWQKRQTCVGLGLVESFNIGGELMGTEDFQGEPTVETARGKYVRLPLNRDARSHDARRPGHHQNHESCSVETSKSYRSFARFSPQICAVVAASVEFDALFEWTLTSDLCDHRVHCDGVLENKSSASSCAIWLSSYQSYGKNETRRSQTPDCRICATLISFGFVMDFVATFGLLMHLHS